jgi:hypothetical protein
MWLASGDKAHVDEADEATASVPPPPSLVSVGDTDNQQLPVPQVPERRAMPRATQARPSRRRNPPRQRAAEPQVAGTRRRSGRAGRNLAWMHWVLRPY